MSTKADDSISNAGALFEKVPDASRITFPTEPAFVVPVAIKLVPELYGEGQYGVIATAPIPAKTKIWVWTDRVRQIPPDEIEHYLEQQALAMMMTRNDRASDAKTQQQDNKESRLLEAKQIILRQGFVLPAPNDQIFNSNPTDAGRFMNHSNTPTCGPDGTLRDVEIGEELTMDYSFHGNPTWYQEICRKYSVLTEAQVAEKCNNKLNGD
mmetsp:Transcript_21791/g.60573  ORF Transcript_21791/g.60573 Transcript_21791/m.60573 type:complete len:210 (-) Transcript_21791:21-650(-)